MKISLWLKSVIIVFSLFGSVHFTFAQGVWSPVHRPGTGDLVSVFFTSSEKGWVGGDDGFFAFTSDGGGNWTKQNINSTENVNEIYFRNDDNGYLLVGHKIYISKDGGNSWRENIVIRANEYKGLTPEFLSIRFSGKKKGWIVGSLSNKEDEVVDSLLLHTEDGGETWTRIILPAKQELYHVDFVNDENGWIVGADGLILQTQDEGKNWFKQNSGTNESLYNVDFRDSKYGTVVGGKGTILRTENSGMTWDKISLNIPKPPSLLRVSFINDKTGWIVGGGGTILRTDDKGKSWTSQNTLGKEPLYGLYVDKKEGWAVGKKGIILKYIK